MELTNGSNIKKSEKIKAIIYSKPGNGKTTLAGLISGKTIMLSIDGTEQVLEGYDNVDVARIDNNDPEKSMGDFYRLVKSNIDKYDNIFIDNLTHYQKLWLLKRAENTKSGMPEIKDYAILDNHLLNLVESFNQFDANVIITCWETTREISLDDGNKMTQYVPDIRDKISNHIMGIVHIVGRLIKKSDGTRGFILSGDENVFAKNHIDSRKGCLQQDLLNIKNKIKEDGDV